jgi:hypothetical protein
MEYDIITTYVKLNKENYYTIFSRSTVGRYIDVIYSNALTIIPAVKVPGQKRKTTSNVELIRSEVMLAIPPVLS